LHPAGERSLGRVKSLRPTDCLTSCATGLTGCCASFPAQFQFTLGQAGQHAGDHPTRGVGGVDPFPQGAEDDTALAKLANRRHHLGSVATQAVDTDDDDRVTGPGVIQQIS
jgi:hypothetical protein